MKNIALVFLTACLLVACARNGFNEQDIVIDENSIVIDVRTEQEYKAGHLKNSIHIPYQEIQQKIGEHVHNRNEKIILYCRSGRRSGIAKKSLDAIGYSNTINAGSYAKLKQNERKKQKPDNQTDRGY